MGERQSIWLIQYSPADSVKTLFNSELHDETLRKVKDLHKFDCLRANKSTMAWGLEARVPFLDKEFLEYSMSLDPASKMCGNRIEKWLIRNAFDDKDKPYLPESVLWRQKEQFSDGVGYSWIDTLKEKAEGLITDLQMKHAESRFPVNISNFCSWKFFNQSQVNNGVSSD